MAATGYTEWYFQLHNTRTRQAIDDDTGIVNVLTENSPVELTIYSDDRGTSASNPLTMTNGVARFFTADTVTACDLSILTEKSHAVFISRSHRPCIGSTLTLTRFSRNSVSPT